MSQLAPIAFSSMPPVLPSNIAALAEQSLQDAGHVASGPRGLQPTGRGLAGCTEIVRSGRATP